MVLKNARLAQAFVDYMRIQNIECQLAPHNDAIAIVLIDESALEHTEKELRAFMDNPGDKKYQAASWERNDVSGAPLSYPKMGSSFWQSLSAHAGIVTMLVMAISGISYLLMNIGFRGEVFMSLRIPELDQITLSNSWRVITPIFLHFSILHIVFNSLWWWQLGGEIERQLGWQKLLLVTVVAAVIPNLAQLIATGPNFGGLSGVVYALLGYCWWTGWLRPEKGLTVSRSIVGFMLVWLVIGFMDLAGPPTANLAHLFGLIVGCLQAVFDRFTSKKN
ncbi:rhomboid family intramembrane serine protease GlpG [Alginatibacterium sediminis]|uniref:Rhomboid family intramembrane serine protease GlpG n=1 Tax=Alginatibacterium sediminis TaxID=2164068 RepID=A0A420E7A8_9ALTE|nr:rhomboid family intramembrane serine protease GlpG [Alginatibacterium sediminis]